MSESTATVTGANYLKFLGVLMLFALLSLWLAFSVNFGGSVRRITPSPEQNILNDINRAFAMYAHVEGQGRLYPDHASRAVPKYLVRSHPEYEDWENSSLEPWPDERVYNYGRFYFVRHIYDRCFAGSRTDIGASAATELILAFGEADRSGQRNVVYLDGHTEWMLERDFDKTLGLTIKVVRLDHERDKSTP